METYYDHGNNTTIVTFYESDESRMYWFDSHIYHANQSSVNTSSSALRFKDSNQPVTKEELNDSAEKFVGLNWELGCT